MVDMRFLITGHTGFKGAWLGGLLSELGHEVFGISLSPLHNSIFNHAKMGQYFKSSQYLDLTSADIYSEIKKIKPDIVLHLAAQSLVPNSYKIPIETFNINVMGTLKLLEACSKFDFIQSIMVVTSDKVYRNNGLVETFKEDSPLGGYDPYSASKSAADIATESWAISTNDSRICIARSGNVIGGGDFTESRLIPDIVNAITSGSTLKVRNLHAVRPWQHVLDCLHGYYSLVNFQIKNGDFGVWNFGPDSSQYSTVQDLIENFTNYWDYSLDYEQVGSLFHESKILRLNIDKASKELGYLNKLDFSNSVKWTVDWYKSKNPEQMTINQIKRYLEL
jgi:CDP-glucose 4,6-dehydratase